MVGTMYHNVEFVCSKGGRNYATNGLRQERETCAMICSRYTHNMSCMRGLSWYRTVKETYSMYEMAVKRGGEHRNSEPKLKL